MGDGALCEGPVAQALTCKPGLLGGGQIDEGVDAGAGDADGDGGLVVGEAVAERQAQLRRERFVAADGRDDA